ncbi:unnamed protein product, partial [Brassica rapa subsp. narinosa]
VVCIVSRGLCVLCLVIFVALSLMRDFGLFDKCMSTLLSFSLLTILMFSVIETFQHQTSICIVYIVLVI